MIWVGLTRLAPESSEDADRRRDSERGSEDSNCEGIYGQCAPRHDESFKLPGTDRPTFETRIEREARSESESQDSA